MDLDVLRLKNNGYNLIDEFGDDVFVIKGFCSEELCQKSIKKAHSLMRDLPHREERNGVFFSFDVLPENTQTNRVFRTIEFKDFSEGSLDTEISSIFEVMLEFQSEYVVDNASIEKGQMRRFQFIHYPKGGGFFDWHEHPRYPVNYGMILNLSKNSINFDMGATEIIRSNGETICVEDFSNCGDLILFKYDLKHRVAPCNPNDDLIFDVNGRWTAIMPIF